MSVEVPLKKPLRRFKPYPAYKDSGIEWLGKIPAHWDVVPLKRRIASLKDGTHGTFERLLQGVPLLSAKNVGVDGRLEVSEAESLISEKDYEQINRNGYLRRGDLLLTIVGTIGRAAVFDYPEPVAFQRSVAVIRPRSELSVEFLLHLSQADFFQQSLQQSSKQSAQGGVYLSDVAVLPVLSPPQSEQRAIAAFLDWETARIGALVAKKERLIELLQEKRTALITRAVTKGLDPNVPTKDSGVEWLGEIPAHWHSFALSRVTLSRCDGPFGTGLKAEHYSGAGVRVIRLQNIGWTEFLDADQAYIDQEYARELGDHSVIANDLLIGGLGDEGHPVGRACVAPNGVEPAMVKADCFRFRLDRRRVVPRFAAYQLSASALAAAGSLATGATRARMNLTATASRKIAVPPPDEQEEIVEALDREQQRHLAIVNKVHEAIERLKELRTALISAAVTGKIDVREEIA